MFLLGVIYMQIAREIIKNTKKAEEKTTHKAVHKLL